MDSKSLVPMRYELLPLGSIKPQGWVKDQLQLSADGLGGHLFKFYRFVKDSTWMGGTEEYSPLRESAPYWYNYIVPLAYSLDNEDLKDQANKFLTRLLDHQHEDGWIGPETTKATRGIWARCLILQGMMNHAIAEPEKRSRILEAMLMFTKLAHCMLSDNFTGFIPTDGDEFDPQKFGQARAHELSTTLQWLYEQVEAGYKPLIWDTMDLMWKGGVVAERDWSKFFTEDQFPIAPSVKPAINFQHGVNLIQGLRYMPQQFRMNGDTKLVSNAKRAVDMTFQYHGTSAGSITSDEYLGGLDPHRGSELCVAVEILFTFAYLYRLWGDTSFADRAELAAFNALPAGIAPDWWSHQYVTQANQPWARQLASWPFYDNGARATVYGLEPEYPCCTVNHPTAFPKFLMNAFLTDKSMSSITHMSLIPAKVELDTPRGLLDIEIKTRYPFGEIVHYTLRSSHEFDLYIRMPGWAQKASIIKTHLDIDLQEENITPNSDNLFQVPISPGISTFSMFLDAQIRVVPRQNNTVAIYRGALLYALDIPARASKGMPLHYRDFSPLEDDAQYSPLVRDTDLVPEVADSPFPAIAIDPSQLVFHHSTDGFDLTNPVFASGTPPVQITAAAIRISNWGLEGDTCAPPPLQPLPCGDPFKAKLVPYGSAKLHMAEFPVVKLPKMNIE